MITQEVNRAYENIWNNLEKENFPISAKEIAAFEFPTDDIRYFFFTEIETYCNVLLDKIANQEFISNSIKESDDYSQLLQLIYDWVIIDKISAQKILNLAVRTKLNYIFSPVETLVNFLFMKDVTKDIVELINRIEFFETDSFIQQNKDELLELQNIKNELTLSEFNNIAQDILINLSQNQTIEEFLQPINLYFLFTQSAVINVELLMMFFVSRDLRGISNEIKKYSDENAITDFSYDKVRSVLEKLFEENIDNNFDETSSLEEPADVLTSELVEDSASELVEDSASEFVEDPVSEFVEDPASELVEDLASEFVEDSASELVEDPASELVEDLASELVEDLASELVEDSASEFVEDSVSELVEDSVSELVEDPASEFVEDSASELVEDPVSEFVEDPTSEFVEDSVSELVEEPVSDLVEDPASALVEAPVSELVEEPVSELVEDPTLEETAEEEVDILQVLDEMRSANSSPYEIEMEYLKLEQLNISRFRDKLIGGM
ncbi:MAG: hypothetical protein GX372_04150 [Ignavibacteria bacterium]|jgi:hypothetical protein|nr:hypothetical protein [Ignavibacteria bacterium]